jgi:hypothetical protein
MRFRPSTSAGALLGTAAFTGAVLLPSVAQADAQAPSCRTYDKSYSYGYYKMKSCPTQGGGYHVSGTYKDTKSSDGYCVYVKYKYASGHGHATKTTPKACYRDSVQPIEADIPAPVQDPALVPVPAEPATPAASAVTARSAVRLAAAPAAAPTANVPVLPGTILRGGQAVRSESFKANLVMQMDGNVVVYDENNRPRWASGTWGNPGATLRFQTDGNLVVYTASGLPIWASQTYGNSGARLEVQDDGNVVIYNRNGLPIWATGTHH